MSEAKARGRNDELVALKDTPHGRRPLAVLLAILAVLAFDGALFTIAAPEISRALDLDVTELLDVVAFVAIVTVVAGIWLAWLMDRWRRLPFVWGGYALSGLATVLIGRAGSYGTLGAAMTTDRTLRTAADTPLLSLLADWYPPEARGRVFSAIGAVGTVGRVAGLITVAVLVDRVGYRTAFVVVGVALLLTAAAAGVLLREPTPGGVEGRAIRQVPPTIVESFRLVYAVPTTRRLVVSLAIFSVGAVISAFAVPFLLADDYGLDAVQRGLVLVPTALGAILGARTVGRFVDRIHARAPDRVVLVFAAAILLTAVGMLVYVARPPLPVLVVALFPLGFVGALAGPALNTVLTALIPPAGRTVGLQLVDLPVVPALVLGPALAAVLEDEFGLAGLFLGAIPFYVVAALVQVAAAPGYAADLRRIAAAGLVREAFEGPDAPVLVARIGERTFRLDEGESVVVDASDGLVAALEADTPPPGTVVQVRGRDLFGIPPGERPAAGLAVVGTDARIAPDVTVAASLRLAATDEETLRRALSLAPDVVGLGPRRGADLTATEHWLAALVRAVASGADVLVLDPAATAGIDVVEVAGRVGDLGRTVLAVQRSAHAPGAPATPPDAIGDARLVVVVDPHERLDDLEVIGAALPNRVRAPAPTATDLTLDDLLAIGPPRAEDLDDVLAGLRLPKDVAVGDLDPARRRLVGLVTAVAAGHQAVVAQDPTAGLDGVDAADVVGDLWRLKRGTDARLVLVAPGPTPADHLADARVVRT